MSDITEELRAALMTSWTEGFTAGTTATKRTLSVVLDEQERRGLDAIPLAVIRAALDVIAEVSP